MASNTGIFRVSRQTILQRTGKDIKSVGNRQKKTKNTRIPDGSFTRISDFF